MDTFWVLLYFVPTFLVVLSACPLPYVLLIAALNVFGGWTIIGWFAALWLAGEAVKQRGPLGIVQACAWLYFTVRRPSTDLSPTDRREAPRP